jgi:hypothetical protein
MQVRSRAGKQASLPETKKQWNSSPYECRYQYSIALHILSQSRAIDKDHKQFKKKILGNFLWG